MRPFRPSRARGFSMVELMVAMLIGLIGMIIIFQVFEVSEGIKRSTTSGGDAQQNGAVALYVVEHDLRNAGMGFNDAPFAGCNILAYDSKRAVPNFTLALVPALICAPGSTAPGGMCPGTGIAATTPDRLTIFYGSQPLIASATPLGGNVNAPNDPVTLSNIYGYRAGDLLVLLQPASGTNCSLIEVTGFTPPPLLAVNHAAAGSTYPLSAGTATARFNPPGGLSVLYGGLATANVTRAFNLGNLYEPASAPNLPVYNTYAIGSDPAQPDYRALTVASALVIDTATGAPQVNVVADNIVQMRAQYGLDDGVPGVDDGVNDGRVAFGGGTVVAGDGLVDRFVSAAAFNALPTPPWQSLIAVRLAIVARSALAEKPSGSDGTNCDATTDGTEATPGLDRRPRWSGGSAAARIDVSAFGDPVPASPLHWKCYRYRVFETTVPLRNWIWRSS
ncbi:MAG: PilW family protein [Burkholderiales bacterium]